MSFQARRRRDEERDHEQAVVSMRDSVCRIVAARMPGAGSAATEDAVDAALLRLFARNEHLAALDYVKRGWIIYACQRLLDEQRSAAARRLDPVDAEEHPRALALSATVHASDVSEQERPLRVPEIFGVLHGDQRRWAEAWFDRRLETGKQPRGLDQALGWSASKTKSVSGRARGKMKAYIRAYANGEVCIKQRALLDTLIDATDKQLPAQLEAVPQLEAVLMHVASCDECRAAWHSRRRAVRERTALSWLPFGPFVDAWDGLQARASGVLHAAHNAAFWIAQRVGISSGDSAGAAVVSGGAAVGGKVVAVCVGAACAVGAARSGLVGVVQPITPQAEHRPERPTKRTAAKPAVRAVLKPPPAGPRIVTAPPPPHAAASPKRTEAQSDRHFTPGDLPLTSPARTSTATGTGASPRPVTRDFTPGDLPPAPSNSTSSAPQPPLSEATSSDARSSCTPGDLGC